MPSSANPIARSHVAAEEIERVSGRGAATCDARLQGGKRAQLMDLSQYLRELRSILGDWPMRKPVTLTVSL